VAPQRTLRGPLGGPRVTVENRGFNLSLIVEGRGVPGHATLSKYSDNRPRSLHLNIIRWPCGC